MRLRDSSIGSSFIVIFLDFGRADLCKILRVVEENLHLVDNDSA